MQEVMSYIMGKIVDFLPAWFRRRLFKPEAIKARLTVEFSSSKPGLVNLTNAGPQVTLWLRITNFSHVDIELDRLLAEVWISQPILEVAFLERPRIRRQSSSDDIRISTRNLSEVQVKKIRQYMDVDKTLTLYYKAFFESSVGRFSIDNRIEYQNILIEE